MNNKDGNDDDIFDNNAKLITMTVIITILGPKTFNQWILRLFLTIIMMMMKLKIIEIMVRRLNIKL